MKRISILIACAAMIAVAAGCSTDHTNRSGVGGVRVMMTDAPMDIDAVNLVIRGVTVHRSGTDDVTGWETVDAETDSTTFDLMTLRNGVFVTLGVANVPTGHYDQVRLLLGTGSTVVVDGVVHPLEVPSGSTSGIKLNGDFDVTENRTIEIGLDFDAARSIHETGNGRWMMNPVIRFFVIAGSGRIMGTLSPADVPTTIFAIANGETLQTASAGVSGGTFTLAGLSAGTYQVAFDADSGWRDTTLANVSLGSGATVDLGTVTLTHE